MCRFIFLPTFADGLNLPGSFYHSLKNEIENDEQCTHLRIFSYAVSNLGWKLLRDSINGWQTRIKNRTVEAYIGVDHGITEPGALRSMLTDGVDLKLARKQGCTYHPKVIWLSGPNKQIVWTGSNNLTYAGLLDNIEFAALLEMAIIDTGLNEWYRLVQQSSTTLDDRALQKYEKNRTKNLKNGTYLHLNESASIQTDHFTSTTTIRKTCLGLRSGDLILQVTEKETGGGGSQIQFPMRAICPFFGLRKSIGSSTRLKALSLNSQTERQLTMTVYRNHTARLSMSELAQRTCPCIVVFHKEGSDSYSFEIVRRTDYVERYQRLLDYCVHQTRSQSRKWIIVD